MDNTRNAVKDFADIVQARKRKFAESRIKRSMFKVQTEFLYQLKMN